MANSDTEIANLAIAHLGIGKEIADLTTENSQEAKACRRFYTTALEYTLRDFPWPFATRFVALAEIEEDPDYEEWGYSYRYPSDALYIKRVLSGSRNDNRQSRVPYKVLQDDDGLVIYTDLEDAQIEYVRRETDTTLFSADFTMAFSWRLAFYIVPWIAGGDPFGLRKSTAQMYDYEIKRAEANAANEEQPDEEPDAEWIRER